ncbi:MAG: DNA primase [Candidatus Omnitrophica bacterium]|nr:DNA primase [Candidatus Omnitrophota bacterium]
MPKTIPAEVINDIQDRCDLVELIASYIPLKRAGRNFKANCPFHNEKTPSFVVSPDKQIYHCFGCGEGGNAISFLMKYEHLDFREALETLAKRVGVAIQFEEKGQDSENTYINELYRINEFACDFYHNFLLKKASPSLNKYLQARGLKEETIKKFKIGLAPEQWDGLLNYLRTKSINIKLIEKAGLVIAKDNGGFYDRFRERLLIPVFDIKNRVIAFGGRTLDNNNTAAKYINSPETQIYIKGKNLFGLNLAKDAIREKDCCIIVEGYFDVIMPMQEGVENIVASSGTALTPDQIRLIKRYTKNVIVIYDADKAGQLATLRSLDLFLDEEIFVRVANLPKGHDPDLFVRKFGKEKFQGLIEEAQDVFDYKLNILCQLHDVKKVNGKTKIALEMLSMIKRIKNEITKSEYIKLLSEKISISESSLLKEINKIKTDQNNYDSPRIEKDTENIYPKAEKMLIKLILDDARITESIKGHIDPGDLQDKRLQKILALAFELYNNYQQIKPNQIISYLDDDKECINLISELSSEETLICETNNRENIVKDCLKQIELNNAKLRCQYLQTQIKSAEEKGDSESMRKLVKEFDILMKRKGKPHNEEIRN